MPLAIDTIGSKLVKCRNRLQLKIEEVSEGTGISTVKLKSIESGEVEANGDEILILADFYKEDYKFFISNQQKSGSEEIEILYRKFDKEFTKEDRWSIQEFLYLCQCEQDIFDLLNQNVKPFSFQVTGTFYKEHGAKGATALRAYLGYQPNELLRDAFNDFRRIGVHIFRRKLNNSNISGLFILHPNAGKCVLINYSEDTYRQNFTLAHEIAHSIFDSEEKFNVSFHGENDLREIRANVFASSYLLPEKAIVDLNERNWTIEKIRRVAIQLKVNITPLIIKLKDLSQITNSQYESFRRNYIEESEKEDFELMGLSGRIKNNKKTLIERGLSSFYIRKCHEAYELRLITSRRLAEMLLTDEFELPEMLALFNLKLTHEY